MLTSLIVAELGGQEIAIQAAKNFRALRKLGVTVRKTIDTVIATRCIEGGYELLHNDRDFDPFAKHLGLRVVSYGPRVRRACLRVKRFAGNARGCRLTGNYPVGCHGCQAPGAAFPWLSVSKKWYNSHIRCALASIFEKAGA